MVQQPTIRSKRHGKLRRDVILLHDNTRPQTANQNVETVNEMGFELMEHQPYSPDLASSDFHTFGPMKEGLRGRSHWRGAKLVKDATKKLYFLTELRKLVKRWNWCVENS
jgi:histone-lysine N-methyltransferase SETMAR